MAELIPKRFKRAYNYGMTALVIEILQLIDDINELFGLNKTGMISEFAGTTAPRGYLLCDGTQYPIASYRNLFNVIGYTYGGSGDFFHVPDRRGRIGIGASADFLLGSTGGSDEVTLSQANLPAYDLTVTDPGHNHTQNAHTHTQNAHTHTQNSHTHTQNAHTHVQDSHNHTQNSHNHTQNSHNHTQSSHNHTQNSHQHFTVRAESTADLTPVTSDRAVAREGTGGTTSQDYELVRASAGVNANVGEASPTTATNDATTAVNVATTATNDATTATNIAATATNQNATATNQSTTATNQDTTATNQNTTATNNPNTTGITVSSGGGDEPVSILPPYMAMNYIIKT